MSWKKLATVAVCALMTTSAWAGPTLDLRNTGIDTVAGPTFGAWKWELRATPDSTLFTNRPELGGIGGSLAIELGLTSSQGNILAITPNPGTIPNATTGTAAAPVEFENPGNVVFGWEKLFDVQNPALPDVPNMKPVGILLGSDAADTLTNSVTDPNDAFLSLGTTFFKATDVVPTNGHLIATIYTTGPLVSQQLGANNSITTSLQVLGSYPGSKGAIAQTTGEDTAVLFDDFAGSASQVIRTGDANLLAGPELNDLIILSANFNKPGTFSWLGADFNGSTGGASEVDLNDLIILSENFNKPGNPVSTPYTFTAPNAGGGSATAVPEPSSIALVGFALLAGFGFRRRK